MKNHLTHSPVNSGRRRLIAGSLAGSLVLGNPVSLLAQQSVTTTAIGNDIYLVSGAGSNVLVALGPESVLVVDGGLQEFSADLLREIDALGQGRPVTTLFNTNWRPEHCGLNHVLGPAGADIIAHENTRLWQNNDFTVGWEERHHRPMPIEAQANRTFYDSGSLALGSETVDYGLLGKCHTDGDIYVHFREANILFAGDALAAGAYPVLDYITGGWIGGAQEATAALLELANGETRIIPASGGPQGIAALERQQQMLDHAYEKVAEAFRTGRSLEQFMATSPMAEYDPAYGDSTLFTTLLYQGTWYHVPARAVPGII